MKKTLCLLLAILMLLPLLYSCGDKENPASDFKYEENEDGGITIISYRGTDPDVVVPAQIDGKNVTTIQIGAFERNTTITTVKLPNTLLYIKGGAFAYCTSLISVSIPQSVKTIGGGAFERCTSLKKVKLPDNLTSLGTRAFAECSALRYINIPANALESKPWEVFIESGLEKVDLAEGITVLPRLIFAHTNIKAVHLPDTIRTIEYGAFTTCTSLQSIALNAGLQVIDDRALANCPLLTEITLPSTVEEVSEYSFYGSNNIESIKFEGNAPDNFTTPDAGVQYDSETINFLYPNHNPTYTIYYHEGAEGFTSPEWNGYPTEIW